MYCRCLMVVNVKFLRDQPRKYFYDHDSKCDEDCASGACGRAGKIIPPLK